MRSSWSPSAGLRPSASARTPREPPSPLQRAPPSRRASQPSYSWLAPYRARAREETADVVGESLGVLEQERVAAVGVDRQLTVGNLAGEHGRIDRRKQPVAVAVGHERRRGDVL